MNEFTSALPMIAVASLLMLGSLLFLLCLKKGKGRPRGASGREAFFYRLYFEYAKTPFAKRYVTHMARRLKHLSVFTKREIYSRSALYFTLQACCVFGFSVAGLLAFDDPVSLAFCVALSYFVPSVLISHRLGNMHYRVYMQLKVAIEALRLEYLRCRSVVEALERVECGNRLVKAFDGIKKILVSAHSELMLKEFYESVPFLPVQTLAQICYHVENTGDAVTARGSAFENALLTMTKDVNQELERLDYQHMKFGKVEFACLVGFPAIPLIQWFLGTYMPGTLVMFEGIYGFVVRVLVMSVSLYGFYHVATINSLEPFRMDDRVPWVRRLSRVPWVAGALRDVVPKDAGGRILKARLRHSFSKKTPEYFYLTKALWFALFFSTGIATFWSAVTVGRSYMSSSTSSLSLVANDDLAAYEEEDILALDREYMAMRDEGCTFEEEEEAGELDALIRLSLPGLSDMKRYDQKTRLEKKYSFLKNVRFRWYYVPLSFFAGCAGWFIPDAGLRNRRKRLVEAEEEEFLQIQTFMMILMGMNCDTMEAVDYLGQLSRIHKEMFVSCFQGYAADPVGELERMEEKTPVADFKRFIGKLKLTVDELSLEDAYGDILIDREHILNERDEALRDGIDNKRRSCGKYVMAGAVLCVVLLFMFPLLYIGYTDMMSGISTLQGMG